MPLSRQTLESLYQTMVRIRRFDERTVELFNSGQVKGTAHSYVGQEAVAAGACAHLTKDDSVISNHRGHGHCIAKGARLDRMMAELMGREDGYCRGLGGSMHIAALDLNILGANGIVAAGVPIGAGAALANKLREADRVVVSFFGDGGANQGVVHETMNLAVGVEAPLHLRVREQQVRAQHRPVAHDSGRGIVGARPRLRHAGRARGRQRPPRRSRGGGGGGGPRPPRRGAELRRGRHLPLGRPQHARQSARATAPSRKSSSGSRRTPWRAWSGGSWTWERASSTSRSCASAWRASSTPRWPTGARAPSRPWR